MKHKTKIVAIKILCEFGKEYANTKLGTKQREILKEKIDRRIEDLCGVLGI